MGLSYLTEENRPLVHKTLLNSESFQSTSNGYVNGGICEPEKITSIKSVDSCLQSVKAISIIGHRHFHDKCEFKSKKKFIKATSDSTMQKIGSSTTIKVDNNLNTSEQNELKGAAWFQAGIPREISLEVLSRQNPGAFLVRQSSTKPGCFALSLRVPPPAPKVAHYLILTTSRGYKIKGNSCCACQLSEQFMVSGIPATNNSLCNFSLNFQAGFSKEFPSLRALITHHSVMPELLPVPLSLPRPTNKLSTRRDLDDLDTYGSLNDFRNMMSEASV